MKRPLSTVGNLASSSDVPFSPRGPRLFLALALLASPPGCRQPVETVRNVDSPPPQFDLRPPTPLFQDEGRPGAGTVHAAEPRRAPPAAGTAKAPAAGEETPAAPLARQPLDEAASSARAAAVATAGSAFREEARSTEEPSASARHAGAEADSLDALFREYRERFRSLAPRPAGDDFALIERADLEAKLIALFFLRDRRNLEDYREIIRSFQEEGPGSLELELLKAALYQKIGQADLRDRAMERAAGKATPAAGALSLGRLAFAREIRGYRSYTPRGDSEFRPGEDVLLYGEIEGFRNVPTFRNGSPAHRRSFSAELVLRRADGQEVDRRELLRAGAAVEVVDDAAKPVHFWGRYPLPAGIAAGAYRLEVEANDLEGHRRVRGGLPLKVR
jgi:hypothetical protein